MIAGYKSFLQSLYDLKPLAFSVRLVSIMLQGIVFHHAE